MSRSTLLDGEASAAASQRVRKRDSLFLMARLTLPDAREARAVRVRNLSAGGLMVEMAMPVKDGTPVTMSLRGIGEITGRTAWCAEGRVGIAFDHPIDPKLARKPVGNGSGTPVFAKPALGY